MQPITKIKTTQEKQTVNNNSIKVMELVDKDLKRANINVLKDVRNH